MKTKFTLLLLFYFFNYSWSQIIFNENIGNPSGTTTITTNTFSNSGALTYFNGGQISSADIRVTSPSNNYSGHSASGNVFFSGTAGAYGFSIEGINASNYSSLILQYGYKKEAASFHATFSVDYWDGTSWETLANTPSALFNEGSSASGIWYLAKTLSLPTAAQINGLKIRFVKTGTVAIRIDDIKLIGTEQVAPTVVNATVTNVSDNSVTFGGNVTATGGSAIALTGTVYAAASTNSNPIFGGTGVLSVNTPSPASGTGTFFNSSGAVLSPNVQYSYNAFATTSDGVTGYGSVASFFTLASIPAAPAVTNATSNTLTVTIGSDSNSNTTTYAIFETGTNTYVQSNGALGISAVYQTTAGWGSKVVTGLITSTPYTFQTHAKNDAGVITLAGASNTETTLAHNSALSDIIFNSSSSVSNNSNINYSNYQVATITSTVNSVGVMGFYLRDGGAGLNDADNLATELTDISFTVGNGSSIRSARLFVGNAPQGVSMPVYNDVITFTGLTGIVANDNTQLAIHLRITFNSTVTDNEQLQFIISSAIAKSSGSSFVLGNAGGAGSSTSGDINRIEVTASKLGFLQQPPSGLYADTVMTPSPTVVAKDELENRDMDFTNIVTLTTTGNLNYPLAMAAVSGLATFTDYVMDFFSIGLNNTLTASSNNLTAAISNPFDVFASPNIATNIDVPTCNINNDCNLVPNGDFEEYSELPTGGSQLENACGWYNASGSPDYFHSNAPSVSYQIPCNSFGTQTCNGGIGNGYAGFAYSGADDYIQCETMVARLYSPLLAGQSYSLSFDVSLADNASLFSKAIQAYLSPHKLNLPVNNHLITGNPPMLFSNTTTSIVTNGWETLTFTFTSPTGGEEYIYLGALKNPTNQPHTRTLDPSCYNSIVGTNLNASYYYIDNVRLVPINNNINAVDDDFSSIPIGTSGGNTSSVYDNDVLNDGTPANSTVSPSIVSVTPAMNPMPTINADGIINVPAGTPFGTYTVIYEIVDNACNSRFDAASVSILVSPLPPITNCPKIYLDEFCYSASQSQTTSDSIFGLRPCGIAMIGTTPCDSSNVTIELITPIATGCTFNPDGTITIAAGTMPFDGESFYILRSIQYPTITSGPLRVNYGIVNRVNVNYPNIWLHAGSAPYDIYVNYSVNILTDLQASTINPNTDGSCGLITTIIAPASVSNTVTVTETTTPQNPYYQIDEGTGFVQFRPPYSAAFPPPAPTLPQQQYILTYTMCINNTGADTFCNDADVEFFYYYENNNKVMESTIEHDDVVNDIVIYPNPSSDGMFTLSFGREIYEGTVDVFNLLGQKLKQNTLQNVSEQPLDLSNTATGTYIVRIQDGAQQIVKRIMIK